jgi:hypothetical protein
MEEPDSVYCMHDLPDGGVLIGAVGSWFHYDLATGLITVDGVEKVGDEWGRSPCESFLTVTFRLVR